MTIFSRTAWLPAVAGGVGIALASAGAAMAQVGTVRPQDPTVGGQLNQCWGVVASQLAQLPSPAGTSGGGMGMHSRATTAANINGGFASNSPTSPTGINGFRITLNTLNADGNHGRQGVGNVSAGPIHNAAPGDGGNGQHAINNGEFFSPILDPVTGQFGGPTLSCDLGSPNIIP